MSTIESPQSPGSFSDYMEQYPGMSEIAAKVHYFASLTDYRTELAESKGITIDDLHESRFSKVVDLTMQAAQVEVA